jgi:hypothetical protein
MLSCLSISRNYHEARLLTTIYTGTGGETHASHLSVKKLNDVYCSQPQAEQVVSPVTHLPVPGSKLQSNDFLDAAFTLELRIRNLLAHYLSFIRQISPSLTARVIIFPFHYFW